VLPDHVQAFIDAEIAANRTDFSDLRAVILNGTLKPSPTPSHTDGLIDVSGPVLRGVGARVDTIGQWSYHGKVGGVLVTGNEDGGKHCAAQMLSALSHIGFTIPPQADAYWVGEAGPGPSYLDDERGAQNHWTTRNTVFAAWNMLHTARRLKDHGGLPAHGNVTTNWDLGSPTHPNPEYR